MLNPLQISLSVARCRMSRPHSDEKKPQLLKVLIRKVVDSNFILLAVGLLVIGIIGNWIEDSLTENNLK